MDPLSLNEPYLSIYEFILGRLKLRELLEVIEEYQELKKDEILNLIYDVLKNIDEYQLGNLLSLLVEIIKRIKRNTTEEIVVKLLVLETLIPFLMLIHKEEYTIDQKMLYKIYLEYDFAQKIWRGLGKQKQAEKFLKAKGFLAGMLGYKFLKEKKYRKAIKMFTSAKEIHMLTGENNLLLIDLYNLGIASARSKDFSRAIMFFNEAIKIDDQDKEIWRNLGIAYRNIDKYNEAIQCFKKAIELDEGYFDAKYNLAHTLLEGYSLNKRRIRWMKDGLTIANNLLDKGWKWTLNVLLLLGAFYFSIEDYLKAAEMFNQAVDIIQRKKYSASTTFEIANKP